MQKVVILRSCFCPGGGKVLFGLKPLPARPAFEKSAVRRGPWGAAGAGRPLLSCLAFLCLSKLPLLPGVLRWWHWEMCLTEQW